MLNAKVAENSTHITLVTSMQFIGYMATQDTKFYVQLRQPTDRYKHPHWSYSKS